MTIFWDLNRRIALLARVLPGRVFASWLKELPDSTHEVQTPLPQYYFIKGPMYLRTDGCYSKGERGVRVGRGPGLSVAQESFRPCDVSLDAASDEEGTEALPQGCPCPAARSFCPTGSALGAGSTVALGSGASPSVGGRPAGPPAPAAVPGVPQPLCSPYATVLGYSPAQPRARLPQSPCFRRGT